MWWADPGVVHQDIDSTEAFDRGVDEGCARLRVSDIRSHRERLAVGADDVAHDGLRGHRIPTRVVHDDLSARAGKRQRDRPADPA